MVTFHPKEARADDILGLQLAQDGPGGEWLRARRRKSRGPLRKGAAQVRVVLSGVIF